MYPSSEPRGLSLLSWVILLLQTPVRIHARSLHSRQQAPPTNNVTFAPCSNATGPFTQLNATTLALLQCANLTVPSNHSEPGSQPIQLALVKLPASGQRIGNLFINPGGPGGPASTQLSEMTSGDLPMGDAMRRSFDIIAMDPRGVGLSSPIRCNLTIANEGDPTTAFDVTTADGAAKLVDYNKRLGESCRTMSGSALVDNMDTIAVAKDMESVRLALGDEPMNYFGQSYGTQLGAQYAQLYPDKVRAVVLDGVLQHTGGYTSNVLVQTTSLDRSIQEFFTRCETNASAASCGPMGPQLRQTWANLVEQARNNNLTAQGCDNTPKTGCSPAIPVANMLGTARGLLESPGGQARLARSLTLAAQGNLSFTSIFANGLLTGDPFEDSSSLAITQVQCADGHFVDAQRFGGSAGADGAAAAAAARIKVLADLTRTFTSTPGMDEFYRRVVTCTGYPVAITNPRAALNVSGLKTPALVVHTRFDPATSPAYAAGMLEEFAGSGARLVVREGMGHTSYYNDGEAARVIERYLVQLEVPTDGTVVSS